MKIYFGTVPHDCRDCDQDDYYYSVELQHDNDQVMIADSCDRHVPISVEHLDDLIQSLTYLRMQVTGFTTLFDNTTE